MNAVKSSLAVLLIAALVAGLGPAIQAQPPLEPERLQGIWAATYPTPWGVANEQLVLMHTSTFSRSVVCGSMRTYTTGEYRVGPGFIRYFNDYNPRLPNIPRTETHYYRFNGPNQVVFRDEVVGTTWVANRVGP